MKLTDSILFSYTISKDKKFLEDSNIKEVASFFRGIMVIESRYLKFNEIGESHWITKFEEFATNYLNSEFNNFRDKWEETIGTSWSRWIYQNQKDDKNGLEKFYRVLDDFIRQEMNLTMLPEE
ncbi:MAG: hypothetical protein MI974_13855 [Chitinophagales bacterium]|nr:hypothetical protein [Chitinophagales bacterium]